MGRGHHRPFSILQGNSRGDGLKAALPRRTPHPHPPGTISQAFLVTGLKARLRNPGRVTTLVTETHTDLLCILSPSAPTATRGRGSSPRGRGGTWAQKGQVVCPRSHSQSSGQREAEPRELSCRVGSVGMGDGQLPQLTPLPTPQGDKEKSTRRVSQTRCPRTPSHLPSGPKEPLRSQQPPGPGLVEKGQSHGR